MAQQPPSDVIVDVVVKKPGNEAVVEPGNDQTALQSDDQVLVGDGSNGIKKYDATDNVPKRSSMDTPLIHTKKQTTRYSQSFSLDLDNRIERLSLWIIAYFIIVIADLTANSVFNEDEIISGDNAHSYRLWISADVFVLIGCMIIWFSLHYVPEMNELEAYNKYFNYIGGGLFFLSAILEWAAIGQHSKYNACVSDQLPSGEHSYCESLLFSFYWMFHFFLICIGIDVLDIDILNKLFDDRRFRMIIYCFNIFMMYIIIGSDIDYYVNQTNTFNVGIYRRAARATEAGLFIVSLLCFILGVLILLSLFISIFIMDIKIFRQLSGLLLLIGSGLTLFGGQIIPLFTLEEPFSLILSVVPVVMIVYDLQLSGK